MRITSFPLAIASPTRVYWLGTKDGEAVTLFRTFENKTEALRFMDRLNQPATFEAVTV